MKFNYPFLSKKKLPRKKKLRIRRKLVNKTRVRRQTQFGNGFSETITALNKWNSQSNPPKGYILGYRTHHGLFYTIVGLAGLYYNIPYLTGAGLAGVLDDVGDIDHWLDFERGGDPNSLISFEQSTQYA